MGKDFALQALKKFPLGEITTYIELWCDKQHMLVVDDTGMVMHKGKQCATLSPLQNTLLAKWKTHSVKTHDLNFRVCTTKSTSPHMVCVALLLEYLLDATGHWQHRIQQGNYYAPIGYSDFFPKGVMVARQMGAFTIDKEWFESGKKAFLLEYTLSTKSNFLIDIGLLYGYDFKKNLLHLLK